ncbi:hypothetical protein GCM10027048_08580 [Hymenobacter coalescens]
MQKILLSACLIFGAAATAHVQTAAGQILLGGNVGYYSNQRTSQHPTTQADVKSIDRQFSVSPQVGYFVTDRLALGASGGYTNSKLRNEQPDAQAPNATYSWENRTYFKNVGAFARYYFMTGEKTGFFGQGDLRYNWQNTSYTSSEPSANNYRSWDKGGSVGLMPGFVYFPTDKLGLELSAGGVLAGYAKGRAENNNGSTASKAKAQYVSAHFGLTQLRLGASFYLGQ